jgi:hypothetical protein
MADAIPWTIANSPAGLNPRRCVWFATRRAGDGTREYFLLPSGRLKTFRTADAAKKYVHRLNRSQQA